MGKMYLKIVREINGRKTKKLFCFVCREEIPCETEYFNLSYRYGTGLVIRDLGKYCKSCLTIAQDAFKEFPLHKMSQ